MKRFILHFAWWRKSQKGNLVDYQCFDFIESSWMSLMTGNYTHQNRLAYEQAPKWRIGRRKNRALRSCLQAKIAVLFFFFFSEQNVFIFNSPQKRSECKLHKHAWPVWNARWISWNKLNIYCKRDSFWGALRLDKDRAWFMPLSPEKGKGSAIGAGIKISGLMKNLCIYLK